MILLVTALLSVTAANHMLPINANEVSLFNNNSSQSIEPFSSSSPSLSRNLSNLDINTYIASLVYNPSEQLMFEIGRTNISAKESSLNETHFIVKSHDINFFITGRSGIGLLSENMHLIYPGSVMLANSHIIDNPDIVKVRRQAIKISSNLPEMTKIESDYVEPNYATYKGFLNKLLETWFKEYSEDFEVTARSVVQHGLIESQDQMTVLFGSEIKIVEKSMSIDFKAIANKTKTVFVYRFYQKFYTIKMHPFTQASDLFRKEVTAQNLADEGVNSLNPPLLIDTIVYGRIIYVKLETSSTNESALSILRDAKEKLYHKLEDLNMVVYVLGDKSHNHIDITKVKDMNEVRDIIADVSKFGEANRGLPIFYTAKYVKDRTRAIVYSKSTQIKSTITHVFHSGTIRLRHNGSRPARFYMRWDEISYDSSGEEIRSRKYWVKNSQDLAEGFTETLKLPGNARNIAVKAWIKTGWLWKTWEKIYEKKDLKLVKFRDFIFRGDYLEDVVADD